MTKAPTLPTGRDSGKLMPLSDAEQRDVLRHWRNQRCDLPGERGELPEKPDDLVAYKLLEAAGLAIERGELRQGVHILRLVVKEFRQSREAACARRVIDRLPGQASGQGR